MKSLIMVAVLSVVLAAGCVQQAGTQTNNTTADAPAGGNIPAPENNVADIAVPDNTGTNAPQETPADSAQAPETDKRADLEISGITMDPKTPLVNELVTFIATVKNRGSTAVDSFSYTLSPLVDQATIVSPASAQAASLAPGDFTTIRMQAKIATPGPAKAKSTIDTFNKIDESNETNNQLIVPFRIYTKQNWGGCFGNGKSVCSDLVDASYFTTYPECIPAYNCTSFVTACDATCPFPR